jgi:hypothetical protein
VLLTAIEREPAGDRVGEPTVSSQLAEVLHGVRALRELTGVNPG